MQEESTLDKTMAAAERRFVHALVVLALHGVSSLQSRALLPVLDPSQIPLEVSATSDCPHACSGHGVCVDGTCKCDPGFTYYTARSACAQASAQTTVSANATCHCYPLARERLLHPQLPKRVQLPRLL